MKSHKYFFQKYKSCLLLFVLCCTLSASVANASSFKPFRLTIAHINDSHTYLEPTELTLTVDNKKTTLEVGGFPRVVAKVKKLRSENPHFLFLHAGDVLQGTMYSIKYKGKADKFFLEEAGLDTLTLGNHEFDKGPAFLTHYIESLNFPVLGANVKTKNLPGLQKNIHPYLIKNFSGQDIGIIGLVTPQTKSISAPGPNITFSDPVQTLKKNVAELKKKKINKIIVLSHLGIDKDLKLAKETEDVDVIIGGHSHTLIGSFYKIGIQSFYKKYPIVVQNKINKPVLIVQAWEANKVLGVLDLYFNPQGEITTFNGTPLLLSAETMIKNPLIEVTPEHPLAQTKLETFKRGIDKFKTQKLAAITSNLERGLNKGPGPFVADSMLWKTADKGADLAIINTGGVRRNLTAGILTIEQVCSLLPFQNKLEIVFVTGKELQDILTENISRHFYQGDDVPFYLSGAHVTIARTTGNKYKAHTILILNKTTKKYEKLVPDRVYGVTVPNYLSDGGDNNKTLKTTQGKRVKTGIIDTDAFIDYAKTVKVLDEKNEQRIKTIK